MLKNVGHNPPVNMITPYRGLMFKFTALYGGISTCLTVDRVLVSTDCKDIAKVAKKYGAEFLFIRPQNLAEDGTPEIFAWRHALEYPLKTDG